MNISIISPAIIQLICHIQSGATEHRGAFVSLDIVSAERPGADFIGIDFAVGETSGPESCITSEGVLCLHIVAIDGEVADAIGETCAPSGSSLACCCYISAILFLGILQVESRNISRISDVTCQLAIPSFSGINLFPVITDRWLSIISFPSIFETAIASFYADLAIVPAGSDAVEYSIFIPEGAGHVESYALTADGDIGRIIRSPFCVDAIHGGVSIIILCIFEVHVGYETTIDSDLIIDLAFYVDSHTAIPSICMFSARTFSEVMLILHTSIAGPGDVADFLFEVCYANAEVCEFVSVFASELVKGGLLFCIQLVFFSHEASDDLSQFVTGHVSFALERAIRIAFYDALSGQIGNSLECPVIRGNIRERICSVSGYASGECCYSSQCEDLFHLDSLLI